MLKLFMIRSVYAVLGMVNVYIMLNLCLYMSGLLKLFSSVI